MADSVLNANEDTTAVCERIEMRGTDIIAYFRIETTDNINLGTVRLIQRYGEHFDVGTRYECRVNIYQ
jgi:hypothetical protein